ncbi:MAG: helix-turn-helix transcriptional regulator [Gammaproteobacteria bacterium]|nr:helix-turn-helix transcriptional regulator [Gammaproteobacteria bacterium]
MQHRFWLDGHSTIQLLNKKPAYVFWKDTDSVYIGCNEMLAYALGLLSPKKIIDKTDYDLSTTREENEKYRADDKRTMSSGQPTFNIHESQTLPDGRRITLTTNKMPFLDRRGKIIGLLGYSIVSKTETHELYFIRKAIESGLTSRQAHCLYHLAKGKTIKQIASALTLSPRTVEHYLEVIKLKWKCEHRHQMIEKVFYEMLE